MTSSRPSVPSVLVLYDLLKKYKNMNEKAKQKECMYSEETDTDIVYVCIYSAWNTTNTCI